MADPALGHGHGLVGGSLVTQTLFFFPLYAYAHRLGTEWIVDRAENEHLAWLPWQGNTNCK